MVKLERKERDRQTDRERVGGGVERERRLCYRKVD